MNELELKRLIGKLTGVWLLKEAMPALKGQTNLVRRELIWHEYNIQNGLPEHFPQLMKGELKSFIDRFAEGYKEFVPASNQNDFQSMMFIWYAEDTSVNDEDFKKLMESNIDDGTKNKMLEAAKFIQERGVPLAMSKSEFEQKKTKWDKAGSYNGGDQHRRHFGWAWGAVPSNSVDDGSREAGHIPDPTDDTNVTKHLNKGATLVTVQTRQVDGGWGIFFWDGSETIPIVPQKTLDQMKSYKAQTNQPLNPDDSVVKGILAGAGGVEKFFGYSSAHNPNSSSHKTSFLPCQRRFYLETPDDPKPKGILWKTPGAMSETGKKSVENHPANDGRHRGQYLRLRCTKRCPEVKQFLSTIPEGSPDSVFENFEKQHVQSCPKCKKYSLDQARRTPEYDPHIYVAMLRVNGTLFWQNESNPSEQFPMTQEQVESFNHFKGETFALYKPGYTEYVFKDQTDANKYEEMSFYLNKLRDFLRSYGKEHVASQCYQVILVGPRFTHGHQTDEKETVGVMPTPQTVVGTKPGTGTFIARRDDWVVEKHEYSVSEFRQQHQKGAFNVPQSVTGMAARGEEYGSSAEAAVAKAVRSYNLPERVHPAPDRIQAAQATFEKANQHFADKKQPVQTAPQPQPTQQPIVPVQPVPIQPQIAEAPPVVNQGNMAEPTVEPQLQNDIFSKSSKDILNQLKKLG